MTEISTCWGLHKETRYTCGCARYGEAAPWMCPQHHERMNTQRTIPLVWYSAQAILAET